MNIKHLQQKKEKLDFIKVNLKREFFGIHTVIDQVIEHIQPWYLFNESQTHPLIVNLWGLTGTGKTTLVKRLVELLDKERAFMRMDIDKIRYNNINDDLTDFVESYEDEDYILCFDEFQHARTLDHKGSELRSGSDFNIWDFLDTGEFQVWHNRLTDTDYITDYRALKVWSDYGITMTNGKIYYDKQPKDAAEKLKEIYGSGDETYFVYLNKQERADLYKLFPERFSNVFEFDHYYFKCDEQALLELLFEAVFRKRKAMFKTLSQSLIFVLGNLDEAYHMCKNFSPDISADAFYKLSLNITMTDVKEALKSRFRNEQISRLGNNHIIYPALSKTAYQQVISKYLDGLTQEYIKQYNIEFSFDASVHEVIYNNGVIPTQGVRPVLSTLKTLVNARMGEVLCHLAELEVNPDKIDIHYEQKHYNISYYSNNKHISTLKLKVNLSLDAIREKMPQNRLAVTAVHEAGHAVVSMCLLNDIPSEMTARTADSFMEGYVSFDIKDKVITKQDLELYAARLLAGLEAERLIFGEELITLGSSTDLKVVTRQVLMALSQHGFGQKIGYYAQKGLFGQHVLEEGLKELEEEAEQIISKAQLMTKDILVSERQLLLGLSDQLLKKQKLNADDLAESIKTYAVSFSLDELEHNATEEPHWKQLKNELNSLGKFEEYRKEKRISA